MGSLAPRVHPTERREALRFVAAEELDRFVERQRAARLRVSLMDAFYVRYPSRMGVLHRLAAAGIAIARFAGVSEAYHAIGEQLCPVTSAGAPRTEAWSAYVDAFERGQPADVREEHWLRAHLEDMEAVRQAGWIETFEAEARDHPDDPMWRQLREHMAVTLGTRLHDREALDGEIPLETAMATSLRRVVWRQATTGLALARTYVGAAIRATLSGGPWVPPHIPSDRRLVGSLVSSTLGIARVTRVWRLGVRRRARGVERDGAAWSLEPSLRQVLGDALDDVHPDVRQLFSAMHTFSMTASVHLYHRLGRGLAWVAALLVGQGMYEEELEEVPARFRLFRRDDGSLHFVREFWCDEEIRVFDSDFVVRDVDGRPTLLEVFVDLGVAAQMQVDVLEDGGLAMTVTGLFVRGLPWGVGPARVRFETRPAAGGGVDVTGVLDVVPGSGVGRAWWRGLVGLPERVGEIRYFATPRDG